jgi:hypothetical protein
MRNLLGLHASALVADEATKPLHASNSFRARSTSARIMAAMRFKLAGYCGKAERIARLASTQDHWLSRAQPLLFRQPAPNGSEGRLVLDLEPYALGSPRLRNAED